GRSSRASAGRVVTPGRYSRRPLRGTGGSPAVRTGQAGKRSAGPGGAHRRTRRGTPSSSAAVEQLALDLLDRLRHGDAARAGLRAVVGGAAAPHAVEVVQHREPLGRAPVARVEDEAVRVDYGGGTDVAPVRPEDRAGGRAGGAQDALGGRVEALAVLGALQTLRRRRRLVVYEVGQHRPVGVEER